MKLVSKVALSLCLTGLNSFAGASAENYQRKLEGTFEFIGVYNVLVEMAQGRTEPWRRYDEPNQRELFDRWMEATAKPGISLIDIHHKLNDDPTTDYRDHEIVAGGDIMVNGNGYYRVTLKQKEALDANPWLRVEYVEDVASKASQPTILARHRYPSADHYKVYGREMLGDDVFEKFESAERAEREVLRAYYDDQRQRRVCRCDLSAAG